MLNVVCVQIGNYEGRGREYVAKLFHGVKWHMPADIEWRGICLTDDASMVPEGIEARLVPDAPKSWWSKLWMFRPGMFKPGDRVLFFDLDTIIVGDLADIASYTGKFAILWDFFYPDHMGSALMAWEAGALDHIWTSWNRSGRPQFDPWGDQRLIEALQPEADFWQEMHPGQTVSFKKDCRSGLPRDARVICFHGQPRPHATGVEWVDRLWNALTPDINRKEQT